MSTRGAWKTANRLCKVSSGSRYSVGLGLLSRDRASAVTFWDPWRCVEMRRITTNWSRRWNNSIVLLNREMEWVPPRLRIYATADRWVRTLVRGSRKESGGETIACSRSKCRPKKSRMSEGSRIDFFLLIVHPKFCKSWIVCCLCRTLWSGESARMIQWSR